MSVPFDPYAGFIGLELRAINFTRYSVNFEVNGKIDGEFKSYRLSASSNISLTETEIFDPRTELDFTNPNANTMKRLFGFLEQKIVNFIPLKRFRACKLEFTTGAIYVWEHMDAIVDNLFIATNTNPKSNETWWLIDDLP